MNKSFVLILSTLISFMNTDAQMKAEPKLITVAEFGKYQPIGVAVTPKGRIFVTFPRRQPYQYGLAELVNGQQQPYPDAVWNQYDSTKPEDHFLNVQAVWPDNNNKLWILDPANPGEKGTIPEGVKLICVDLSSNKIKRIYRFEDLPRQEGALNDIRIDTKRGYAYLSDPKLVAIVVLNLKTGKSRQVLKDHPSTKSNPDFKLHLDGKDVVDDSGKPFSSNVNGIALTTDFSYLYYRAINQTKLYRIAVEYLVDESLSDDVVGSHVQTVGETGVSHGMIADSSGNVCLTDSPNKSIRYVTPKGELKTLVKDNRLAWPDSFSIGADGYLYLTDSQINRTPKYNNGQDKVQYPFRLYKIKLP